MDTVLFIRCVFDFKILLLLPDKDHLYVGGKMAKMVHCERQKKLLHHHYRRRSFCFCNKNFMRCDEECFFCCSLPVFCWLLLLLLLHTISVIWNYYSNWPRKKMVNLKDKSSLFSILALLRFFLLLKNAWGWKVEVGGCLFIISHFIHKT